MARSFGRSAERFMTSSGCVVGFLLRVTAVTAAGPEGPYTTAARNNSSAAYRCSEQSR